MRLPEGIRLVHPHARGHVLRVVLQFLPTLVQKEGECRSRAPSLRTGILLVTAYSAAGRMNDDIFLKKTSQLIDSKYTRCTVGISFST